MRKHSFLFLALLLNCFSYSQSGIIAGVTGSRYFFLESPQSNMCAKFNLGWKMETSEDKQLLYFIPTTDVYETTNRINWDQLATGFFLGFTTGEDKLKSSFYFQGASNSALGKRMNLTTGVEEQFKLVSKFGGLRYAACYRFVERLGLFYSIGVNRYRINYEWNSALVDINKTTIGYTLKLLSGNYKPGSKKWNIIQSVGTEIDVLKFDGFALTLRPEFTFAMNIFSEVERGLFERSYLFNLNQFNLSAIIQILGK